MKKEFLGEFEELVLTIVAILEENAYGNAVVTEIKTRLNRDVVLSAVHITLYRLEDKGYLKSHIGKPLAERGGRRKRLFSLTNNGWSVLRFIRDMRLRLWKDLPQLK